MLLYLEIRSLPLRLEGVFIGKPSEQLVGNLVVLCRTRVAHAHTLRGIGNTRGAFRGEVLEPASYLLGLRRLTRHFGEFNLILILGSSREGNKG